METDLSLYIEKIETKYLNLKEEKKSENLNFTELHKINEELKILEYILQDSIEFYKKIIKFNNN